MIIFLHGADDYPAPKRAVLPRLAAGKKNQTALLVTGQAADI